MRTPIAITGLGASCAIGSNVPEILSSLRAGTNGIRPLTRFRLETLPNVPVGEISALPRDDSALSTTHRLAAVTAKEALDDAQLPARVRRDRIALIVGTTTGGIETSEAWYLARLRGEHRDPTVLRHHAASTVSEHTATAIGARGLRLTISTACSSGANAIATAADCLARGLVDVAIAGGVDGLSMLTLLGFSSLRLLSMDPCKPFDRARSGLNLGEAGAFLALERAEDAFARGRRPHAFLRGHRTTCDAHHMTAPAPGGDAVVRALVGAIDDAGLRPSDVSYVNAHGTATDANDRAEALALAKVFCDRVPPVSSSKSFLGHTLGAAGAIEALVTVLALRDGFLPPTRGTTVPDDCAAFDLVLGSARPADLSVALSSSFAFGGNNAVLVFGRNAP